MTQISYEAVLQSTKQVKKMAVAKFMLSLLNLIGITFTGIGIVAHFDFVKTTIAFAVGITILIMNQRHRNRRLKEEQKQREIKTKMMEREYRLNRTIEDEERDEY